MKIHIIKKIIEKEGGYVNDSKDSGGETNYGITIAVARENGYEGLMKDLPYELAYKIYEAKYWKPLKLDDIVALAPNVADLVCNIGVMSGISRAGIFLQRALNSLNDEQRYFKDLIVDGLIGAVSVAAVKAIMADRSRDGESVLLKLVNCLYGNFLVELSEKRKKDRRFIFGWFKNRIK